MEIAIVLFILASAILLFVTERLRVDVVALGVMAALLLTGILTVDEAIAGFASTTVISIAFLFIVGGAIFHTGLADAIAVHILRIGGTEVSRLTLVLMGFTALLSAFISSTGVVALMLPAVVSLARRTGITPSRLLMPLAFSALLGGASTLIGTPPNIIASDALVAVGLAPFDFFAFTPLGGLILIASMAFFALFSHRLLPDRDADDGHAHMEGPVELFRLYDLPSFLHRVTVAAGAGAHGQTLEQLNWRKSYGLSLITVTRPTRNSRPMEFVHPMRDFMLSQGDHLVLYGSSQAMARLCEDWGLEQHPEPVTAADFVTGTAGIAEVLLRPRSALLGQALAQARFSPAYRLTVLGVRRSGEERLIAPQDAILRFGDMLLVHGSWRDIFALKRLRNDFIVMGEPEAAQFGAFSRRTHSGRALIILAGMVVAVAFNLLPLTTASLLAALALVVTGCITMDEAYHIIDWKSLVLIAGMLPLSTALTKVGLVDGIATGLAGMIGGFSPLVGLVVLFLVTAFFTQVLSNTVTAVLVAPIAVALAAQLGVQPQPFLLGIAIAASMAFASPVASPVNTLVMSAGEYRFSDYARAGLPLIAISLFISLLVIPLIAPF